jgi:UDP-N-acetyl-D-mannosaminuronate dehydrogenase
MIYNDLLSGKKKMAVIGLGYVGLPIALEFAKRISVIARGSNSHFCGGMPNHDRKIFAMDESRGLKMVLNTTAAATTGVM